MLLYGDIIENVHRHHINIMESSIRVCYLVQKNGKLNENYVQKSNIYIINKEKIIAKQGNESQQMFINEWIQMIQTQRDLISANPYIKKNTILEKQMKMCINNSNVIYYQN